MRKIDLVKQTVTEAFGCEIIKAKIEGLVVELDTNEGEHISLLLFQRPAQQADEPYFSLSSEGIAFCEGCKCGWIANIYGKNKACSVVAVATPDFETFNEWGDVVRTYANPLCDE